jgi:hypothetical protein
MDDRQGKASLKAWWEEVAPVAAELVPLIALLLTLYMLFHPGCQYEPVH